MSAEHQAAQQHAIAQWQGELLWPQRLEDAPIIDVSGLHALGAWAYEWFRQRPQRAVVGASPRLKRQLSQARLPILWYSHADQVPSTNPSLSSPNRVSSDERALLWGVNDV